MACGGTERGREGGSAVLLSLSCSQRATAQSGCLSISGVFIEVSCSYRAVHCGRLRVAAEPGGGAAKMEAPAELRATAPAEEAAFAAQQQQQLIRQLSTHGPE